MDTVMASFKTVRQMSEMSQWPKCHSKEWPKCLSEKNKQHTNIWLLELYPKSLRHLFWWKNCSHITAVICLVSSRPFSST